MSLDTIGLIQASHELHGNEPVQAHKRHEIEKHPGYPVFDTAFAKESVYICYGSG